jgi:hypothetical protein
MNIQMMESKILLSGLLRKRYNDIDIYFAANVKGGFLQIQKLILVIARFQVESLITVSNETYVLCKYLTEDINYQVSDNSYLGDYPIKKWLDMPRAHDENGNPRFDLFTLVLKNAKDKEHIKTNDIYEMWDDYVDVKESYLLSNGQMIAFLKCYPGKYEDEYKLEDSSGRRWILKNHLFTTGSFKTYEKMKKEARDNIFQYLIQPLEHKEKPEVGTRLRIYRKQ